MADKKITQLPASTVPLAGTEVLPIVQGTTPTTKQVSVADLTAGRAISATQYTSTIATGTPPLVVASTTEVANLKAATATLADSATSANAVKSNTTTGLMQVVGPAAASTRVMTTPDANFTVARTDAAQSFTDNQTLSTGNLVIGTSGKGIADSGGNQQIYVNTTGVGVGAVPSSSAKFTISQSNSKNPASSVIGTGAALQQGNANWITIAQTYAVVSTGTQLIIPFVSQGSVNVSTMVRVRGMTGVYNGSTPVPFTAEFALSHLTTLKALASWGLTGNAASVSTSGMNVLVNFTSAYATGIFVVIEYLCQNPAYSIDYTNITMN